MFTHYKNTEAHPDKKKKGGDAAATILKNCKSNPTLQKQYYWTGYTMAQYSNRVKK